jgi:hypothetical protein
MSGRDDSRPGVRATARSGERYYVPQMCWKTLMNQLVDDVAATV